MYLPRLLQGYKVYHGGYAPVWKQVKRCGERLERGVVPRLANETMIINRCYYSFLLRVHPQGAHSTISIKPVTMCSGLLRSFGGEFGHETSSAYLPLIPASSQAQCVVKQHPLW